MKLTDGLVRILKADGNTEGTGFVVSDSGLIATCAHVVKRAGGGPGEIVTVAFYVDDEKWVAYVEPAWWRDPDAEDVAVLRLGQALPKAVGPLLLGSSRGTTGHRFRSFGFPQVGPYQEFPAGGVIDGEMQHEQGFRTLVFLSQELLPGMSGAPLFDTTTRRVVGMFSSFPTRWRGRLEAVNFAIPSETLREVCDQLEIKDIPPYKGLSPFTEDDAPFFFGREQQVEQLLEQLLREPNLLVLLGASGTGKSSVIQAGLFPELRRGKGPFGKNCHILTIRPGSNPYTALSKVGLIAAVHSVDLRVRIQEFLRAHSEIDHLVVFVDQFEELFILCTEDVQKRFMNELEELLDSSDASVTLILGLRVDFYREFLDYSQRLVWLKRGHVYISPLNRQELKQAVELPARRVGLHFERGLVDTIVNETRKENQPLPLLESALSQLWDLCHEEGVLTYERYHNFGGLTKSVTTKANSVYKSLSSDHRRLAEQIFTRLIYFSPEKDKDTRRWRSLADLARSPQDQKTTHQVIQQLANGRLLLLDHDPDTKTERIEIVHDALLRDWELLKEWRENDNDRVFFLWRQQLQERVKEWSDNERKDDDLIKEKRLLRQAENWLKDRPSELTLNEQEYIRKSIAYQKKRRFFFAVGSALLLAVLFIFVIVIRFQSQQVTSVDTRRTV